jgi:flagellar motility protein MotE (MotC chaperone)
MSLNDERAQVAVPVLLLFVLAGVIAAGIYMMDSLGLIDFQRQFNRQLQSVPVVGEYLVPGPVSQEQYQLDQIRKKENQLNELKSELNQRRQTLQRRADELDQRASTLEEREQELASREQALMERRQQYDSRSERIQYLSTLYSNMQPADAAQRLAAIPQDRIVIGILQNMEDQAASVLLSRMNDQRAGVISRKMAQYPPRYNG